MPFEKPAKILGGESGYNDEDFSRLDLSEQAKIKGYMWAQNLGGLIRPRSADGPFGAYSLTFLTNEELVEWNKGEIEKYIFLDFDTARQLNEKALPGSKRFTDTIINYACDYKFN